ncbi:MAG: hypothetical protein U9R08_03535 [Nanoarchaeota archaeon]|nr:hypothetical protein [Nanoarchaeota archaeon]
MNMKKIEMSIKQFDRWQRELRQQEYSNDSVRLARAIFTRRVY